MAVIYLLTNTINNKQYVGFTTDYNRRMISHKNSNKIKNHISNAINKYGWDNFTDEIIYENNDAEYTLHTKESEFIKEYDTFNNGYNLTNGGEGCLGYKPSDKERERMRISMTGEGNPFHKSKGRKNPMKGKTHTKESIEKMKQNRKGLTAGKDNPMYGKGYLVSGKNNPNSKSFTLLGVKYYSMNECFEKTGISLYLIRKFINKDITESYIKEKLNAKF